VRIFIIFHDCGHGSFFKSNKANAIVGFITGVLTLTPYEHWRHDHAIHHASVSNLDRRGVGDVMTLTVKEYLELPYFKKIGYRAMRHPLVLFLLGPPLLFIFGHRIARRGAGKRQRHSVYWTNIAIILILLIVTLTIGLRTYLLVQAPVFLIAFSVGVWLFYIQHQFKGTYWEKQENWDFETAALKGSSFYKLPKLLKWFSGNIGFHHIHHLSPRIPNYNLEKCQNENTIFKDIKPISLLSSLKSIKLHLWDEEQRMLVGFKHLKTLKLDLVQKQAEVGNYFKQSEECRN
ncbi:MAG: fatty acid desaturase, partial [Anaerolineales bacterium]|nr:fatty acid desaturase [Anaerolineales bacterium]